MKTDKHPAGLPLRLAAIARLRAVLGGEHFAPLGAADIADPRDRAMANRLVTIALRRHGQINVILGELLDKGLPKKGGSFEATLRLSLAQLVYLPELGAHSALFLAVEALKADTRAQHLTGLMNAVLRKAQANSARYWGLPDSLLLPEAVTRKWTAAYGQTAVDDFAQGLIEGAPLDLTARTAPDADLLAALDAMALPGTSLRVGLRDKPVDALPGFAEGVWWVQDFAASLPARLLELPPGAHVLDLCAAPGGKTAQLCVMGYRTTALDSDEQRLDRLRANMSRLGFSPEIIRDDAATHAPTVPYDAIVLDAPCSATGTFRRHPEVLWHRTDKDIASRVALQRRLLSNAWRCLKPGGTLIYCVCSLEPEEGEEQVGWALGALPGLALDPVGADRLGFAGAVRPDGTVRTHPGLSPGPETSGMDGFFIARFRRES